MRVLFWCPAFWPEIGGIQSFAAALLPALQEHGYQFAVVTGKTDDHNDATQYKGIPIYRFPFHHPKSYADLDQLMRLRQDLKELKNAFSADLVHVNSVDLSLFFYLTDTPQSTRSLVTLHGNWPTRDGTNNTLVERLLRTADWVVGCSESVLEQGRRLVPALSRRSSVIYNGREPPPFEPQPLSTHTPCLLCIGRLVPEKGFDVAVTAFGKIHRRFPEARLILAGDGTEKEKLHHQVYDLGLTDRVEFTGWVTQDETLRLLDRATLVVIPSRQEGFSLVAAEAAAMARPVVATRVGGLPEVVQDEKTGVLVPSEDGDALAQAISFLLDHPETAIQMGKAGRRRVGEKFRWDRHVDAYAALYQRLTSKRNLCSWEG
jgi:glycogen(starch) synthase